MALRLIDGNNRFRKLFEKQGAAALQSMYHSSNSQDPNKRIIWVWDGPNGTARRKQLFAEYKGNKHNIATDAFHETTKIFKRLLQHSSALQLEVPNFEADDVIATLALNSHDTIEIDSNDADFLALECDRIKVMRDPLEGVSPEFVRLYKTLVGDSSDNIKGLKGFADKGWQKLENYQRKMLVKHFQGEAPLMGAQVTELCGLTAKQGQNWDEQAELLSVYWEVVGFIEVPMEVLSSHLKAGVYSPMEAHKIFAENLLTMGAVV